MGNHVRHKVGDGNACRIPMILSLKDKMEKEMPA